MVVENLRGVVSQAKNVILRGGEGMGYFVEQCIKKVSFYQFISSSDVIFPCNDIVLKPFCLFYPCIK